MIRTISRTEAVSKIDNSKGRFFGVSFIKRGDGTLRDMNARTKVRKGTNGGKLRFDPRAKGLISVWDAQARGFRFVSIEGIETLNINGERFKVS